MDISVVIPARNEMFLRNTVDDVLAHSEADTEIIVTLDGAWPVEPIPDNPRVTMIYHAQSRGQRAATNDAVALARGKYIMKLDAHCSVAQGFDRIMLEDMQDDWCMVPTMRNLHVFDWVCQACGHRQYQGTTPKECSQCKGTMQREIVWTAKHNPQSRSYCFDSEPHFQYFKAFNNRPEGKGDITDTMSLQGSCWMLTKEMYHRLNVCDEAFGSWGSQGIEVAVKVWLSGGRVVNNNRTWYAHCFRTQGGDFGFPYPLSQKQVDHAKSTARDLFFHSKWDKAIHPLSWLLDKFWPVRGWTDVDLANLKQVEAENQPALVSVITVSPAPACAFTKGIVYYTDNRLDPLIMDACQRQLARSGLLIVSVSLEPMSFGENIVVNDQRGPLAMFRQILAGLEASTADVVFLAEHDVLYHPSHFDFTPGRPDLFYYNQNMWKVDVETGRSLFHYSNHTSQLCARRELLLEHYKKRVALVEERGYSNQMGYEPGTHSRPERVDDYKCTTWMSDTPNIDIRHSGNLTKTRWKREQFRDQRYTQGWEEGDGVPGWYEGGQVQEMLEKITQT